MTDNIVTHIPRVYVETKTFQKSGKPYTTINIEFNRPGGKIYTFTGLLKILFLLLVKTSSSRLF